MVEDDETTSSNVFLKVALSVLVSFLLFGAGAFTFWFFSGKINKETPVAPLEEEELFPADQEATGGAGQSEDVELIRQAFAAKYGHDVSEVEVEISKKFDPYVSGGVIFSGEMGGGWFLAYKQEGEWIIVADGNGTIPCEAIEPYDFPADMAPECYTQDGSLITR
ncbi:MAG TPA: hypothetical protein VMW29_01860 [Candidatus Bathyarchaeia archaeon]|nr:hypothetical protein [Candidatus Bathyarchaeia archaeon]